MSFVKGCTCVIVKNFARNIIRRYSNLPENRISFFLDKIRFVYALPFIVIRQSTGIFKKIECNTKIENVWNFLSNPSESKFPVSLNPLLALKEPSSMIGSQTTHWVGSNFELQTFKSVIPTEHGSWDSENRVENLKSTMPFHLKKFLKHINFLIRMSTTKEVTRQTVYSNKARVLRFNKGTGLKTTLTLSTRNVFSRSKFIYPEVERVVGNFPQIKRETTERIVKKETTCGPQSQQPIIDFNRLANQIYMMIERRIRIERERRGLC